MRGLQNCRSDALVAATAMSTLIFTLTATGSAAQEPPQLVTSGNHSASGPYYDAQVSADGSQVLYSGDGQVVLYSVRDKRREVVSVNAAGRPGNDLSYAARMSDDGRWVIFRSKASNLVPGDTNAAEDEFLRDRARRTTIRLNVNSQGAVVASSPYAGRPAVSGDGTTAVFFAAGDLTAGEGARKSSSYSDSQATLWSRDTRSGRVRPVSIDSSGALANASGDVAVDASGQRIVFVAFSPLSSADSGFGNDIYLYDGLTETVQLVTAGTGGYTSSSTRFFTNLGLDRAGAKLVYTKTDNGTGDSYLVDIATRSTTFVDGYTGPSLSELPLVDIGAHQPSISGDGRFVFYIGGHSAATAGSPDVPPASDVYWYRRDLRRQVTEKLLDQPRVLTGCQATFGNSRGSASTDGRQLAFVSDAPYAGGDKDCLFDVYLARLP